MTSLEAPVLFTPATHILEAPAIAGLKEKGTDLSEYEFQVKYEIDRTVAEIRKAKYTRVALQFPDSMLQDAPRVFNLLTNRMNMRTSTSRADVEASTGVDKATANLNSFNITHADTFATKFYILADTSYGACCVDEIAAEHVSADVVVHYGRACLSPTSRIPVIHIFTIQPADLESLVADFVHFYTDLHQKVILMSDVTYQSHLRHIAKNLKGIGYGDIFVADIIYHPSSALPNRTVPEDVTTYPSNLKDWHLFHISDPPESLLLTLASRMASIRIYPTAEAAVDSRKSFTASTSRQLNRRYGLLTSVATVPIFGILINTLSVKNYLGILDRVKSQIASSGKKCYTFVVGKVNAAKVANFGEIGAWVVIGCWESSLIDSKDFWKPIVTPFELELALQGDHNRVWTGEWSSDFQRLLHVPESTKARPAVGAKPSPDYATDSSSNKDVDSEPESAPPEFDLRTGRYVSYTRPMQTNVDTTSDSATGCKSVIKRAKGEIAVIGGKASPGAEFLRSTRSWKGLGSDSNIAYEETGAMVGTGRDGTAKGYSINGSNVRT